MTIRSMHTIGTGAGEAAKKKTRALAWTFLFCMVYRVGASYAPGILWDWHIFSWFYQWGNYNNHAIHIENWGWIFEWTPAFIGSGMLVGLNPAISFFGGGVVAWGIIGPALIHNGAAFGRAWYSEGDAQYENWHELVNFNSFNLKDPKHMPSPRYWMLWP